MPPDEREDEEVKEKEEGQEEVDDVTVLGLDDEEDEEDEGEDEGEGDEEEGKGDKGGKEEKAETPPTPTFKEMIELAKEELKAEGKGEKPKDSKHPHTREELDHAEEQLAQMMKDETIEFPDYHRYMKNIAAFRKAMDEEALVLNLEGRRKKQSVEENLVQWAETNAPEYLDHRKKATKDAMEWAESSLGVEKRGDVYLVPGKVGPIIFGVLHKGNQSAAEPEGNKGKKADKGYEKGIKDAQKRDSELRNRDNKIPKSDKSGKEAPATSKEREVMETLGLTDLKRYRAMKKMSENKLATLEVK